MGLSDDEGLWDHGTAQSDYYGYLAQLRRDPERNAAALARLEKAGPPPPEKGDGARGWLSWHEHHAPTVEEFTRLLERMEAEGLLTSDEVAGYVGRLAPGSVTELKARVAAVDVAAQEGRRG